MNTGIKNEYTGETKYWRFRILNTKYIKLLQQKNE